MKTALIKLKTNPLGQMIWIAIMCVLHLLLFKSKVNYDIAVWKRIVSLLFAIIVSLPVHELIHLVFMKAFSKENVKIEFARDPLGIPGLRTILPDKVTKVQQFIIFVAPLFCITIVLDMIFAFCGKIELLFFIIAMCNSAGCYYDMIDAAITICKEENGYLTELIESNIESKDGLLVATPLEGGEEFKVSEDDTVSMNMFGFTPKLFDYLEERFPEFLDEHKDNILKCEYLIPTIVFEEINKGLARVEVLKTNAVWQGITYREDKDKVVREIKALVDKGEYPEGVWKLDQ